LSQFTKLTFWLLLVVAVGNLAAVVAVGLGLDLIFW
jgi:hypothetical protein